MSGISTHILDTALGRPASGIQVRLYREAEELASAFTNEDGRVPALLPGNTPLVTGKYRIVFEVGARWTEGFYPEVSVSFWVRNPKSHYHIPLLISGFGFTTYRGS
ncbi:MAG: hydroxyisourate hydrolase [Bryobacteraceae bacterium]